MQIQGEGEREGKEDYLYYCCYLLLLHLLLLLLVTNAPTRRINASETERKTERETDPGEAFVIGQL